MNSIERDNLKKRFQGTNISPESFLATDYLNHFNEIFMLLEMVADMPDMPEMVNELEYWKFRTYQEHFAESQLAEGPLAIKAYEASADDYRLPFDKLTGILRQLIVVTISEAKGAVILNEPERMAQSIHNSLAMMQRLHGAMNCIIHDQADLLDQDAIDQLMVDSSDVFTPGQTADGVEGDCGSPETLSEQDAIDRLMADMS